MISGEEREALLNSKFASLLNSEKGKDITIEDLRKMNENIVTIDIEEDNKMEETNMKLTNVNTSITPDNDDYYLDTDFPIEDLDSVLDDNTETTCDNVTPIQETTTNSDEYDKDELIKQQIEIEMEKKRKYNANQIMSSKIGNSICNYRCSAYTIRVNGHCSICDKKCNGYIESESIIPTKMVDIGALCIMNRKDPKVMYVSMKDIENLVNGTMALVTEDGTCVVFDNKR